MCLSCSPVPNSGPPPPCRSLGESGTQRTHLVQKVCAMIVSTYTFTSSQLGPFARHDASYAPPCTHAAACLVEFSVCALLEKRPVVRLPSTRQAPCCSCAYRATSTIRASEHRALNSPGGVPCYKKRLVQVGSGAPPSQLEVSRRWKGNKEAKLEHCTHPDTNTPDPTNTHGRQRNTTAAPSKNSTHTPDTITPQIHGRQRSEDEPSPVHCVFEPCRALRDVHAINLSAT